MRITVSIPFAFKPVKYEEKYYVDGGLYWDYPITIWGDYPRKRIGHLIYPDQKDNYDDSDFDIFNMASNVIKNLINSNVRRSIVSSSGNANIINCISKGLNLDMFDFDISEDTILRLYADGYSTCQKNIKKIFNEDKI